MHTIPKPLLLNCMENTGINAIRETLQQTPDIPCTQFKFNHPIELGNAVKALRTTGARLLSYGTKIRETSREFLDATIDESQRTTHPDGSSTAPATCTIRDTTTTREVACLVCIAPNRAARKAVQKIAGAEIEWHSCAQVAEMMLELVGN